MGSPNEAAEPGSIDPPASDSDQYCLRWTNHGSHVLAVFRQLLCDEALVDVTLAAEGQSLRAHKMVLSACSSFFRTIFVSHPERHPIIILKDTKFAELKTLLEFMYRGEVSVEYGQLGTLLKTAENLRVKGLTEVSTHDPGSSHPTTAATAPPPRSPETLPPQQPPPPSPPPHRHSLRHCPAGPAANYSQFAVHGNDADDPDVDASPSLFDDRLGGSEPPFGADDVESAGNEQPHPLNPAPSSSTAGAGLQSSRPHWSRERERDRLLHPHHYHPYSRHSDGGPSNHHAYRDRHAQLQPQQPQHRHSPHYTTLDHRERDRERYRPGERSSSHTRSNSSPLFIKRELRTRSDSGTGPEKELEQRFSPNAAAAGAAGDTLAAPPSPSTPPLPPAVASEEDASALIVVERFSPSEALLHPSATNNASTGPLDASESSATPSSHRGASKPPPSPRLVLRPGSTTHNNNSSTGVGEEDSRARTPKQEAEDLRVSSASPPSGHSVNFRPSTGEAGGSSGGGGGGAAQRRFSNWPSLQSESSDTESEDFPMASPSGSRNPSRGPPYRPSSTSGMGPPQHIPLALKKEQDWEGGEALSLPSGGTRPEGPPSRSRSRSPTFSESSSEYGRHADQEVQGSAYSGAGATNAADPATGLGPPRHQPQPAPARGAHAAPSGGFPCARCGVAFPSPSRLSRHLLTHNHLEPERDFGAAPTIFPRDHSEMMQRTSLSIKRRHLTSVLDHNTSAAAAAAAAAAAGLYGRQTATAAHTATIASLAVEERFYEFGRLRTRHGSYEDSSVSRNRAALFADDTGTGSGCHGSNSRFVTAGHFGDHEAGEREAPESHRSASASLNVRGLGSMFSHAMESSSALGALPSVAMLASLMGGGSTEGHANSDLPLGPVMFPRLGGPDAQQLSSAVSSASMVHSMSSLGLSSLSMGLNLAPGQVPPPHHSAPPGSVANAAAAAAAHRASATSAPSSGGGALSVAPSSSNNSCTSGTPALCKFCGKSFLELGALMAHLPFHTGERPFRCDFCGKAFKLRHHMKDHARVHTGERPFPCRLCGKTFSRSTILKAHEKTHLPKSERGFLQPPSPPDGLGSGP